MENEPTNSDPIMTSQDAAPGALTKVFKVFYEPTAVFKSLNSKTAWLVPFIIIVIIGGVFYHFKAPIQAKGQMKATTEYVESLKDKLPPQQYQEIMDRMDKQYAEVMENKFKWYMPLVVIGITFVFMAIISLIGWITGNFIFGGKAGFWVVMNVVAYAALIGLLGEIIRSSLVLSKGSADVFTGLGLLKSVVGDSSFLFYLFRQIDIFSIWRITATCIGLGVIYNMKTKKFGYVLFSLWLVFFVVIAILDTLTGGMVGMNFSQ